MERGPRRRWMEPIIQVAGIRSGEEAMMLVSAGVRWLGFPLRLDVHEEDVSEDEARYIIKNLPSHVVPVLITYETREKALCELFRYLEVKAIQLHGEVSPEAVSGFRNACPQAKVIKSLVVGKGTVDDLLSQLQRFSPVADAFLTDTFDPESGASGATGKIHDWEVSRRIVDLSPRPVILAGGLNPDNVARAVQVVKPAGVDAHTGLEDPNGWKDFRKVRSFVQRARRAFQMLLGPSVNREAIEGEDSKGKD